MMQVTGNSDVVPTGNQAKLLMGTHQYILKQQKLEWNTTQVVAGSNHDCTMLGKDDWPVVHMLNKGQSKLLTCRSFPVC